MLGHGLHRQVQDFVDRLIGGDNPMRLRHLA